MSSQSEGAGLGYSRTVEVGYSEAVDRVKAALKEEGFGVLSEIDIREKFREKLGVEGPPHVILGACNPQLAHRALEAQPDLSLLLPCNVVVREHEGTVEVSAVDAEKMMEVVGNPDLEPIARDANERLRRAVDAV